ncbi:MAG TPA: NAD(P)-dependent oxidoreductase [Ignavibacteriaceae bacterium]|nr:NAD(P)-dependent oxidoreductase [Ignavibacteriaceae bacterium]
MNNLASKLSHDQYEKNFEEIHPPFSKNSAIAEANRCLYCYDAPCIKACPTHIDIPAFIKKISTGNMLGSAKTILESNWAALTCAKACPVQVLCEGACVYNDKEEPAIQIGRLQRFSIDNYFEKGRPKLFSLEKKNGKSVGVVGSGPAGLACGAELALLGYEVTIYEANKIPGGLNTWGIAPYKTRQVDSLKEVELVKSFGVEIQTNVDVGKNISFDELNKKHNAVFIGIGLGESTELKIPGEDLKGVVNAIDFIEEVKKEKWPLVNIGKSVAVIGAGNTSIDAATESVRLGADKVMILYRRSEEEMSAYDFEFDLAKKDGVTFHFLTSPKKIIGKNSVEGIECVKMTLSDLEKVKRRTPVEIPNSNYVIPVDMVIKAIGQGAKTKFLNSISGLKMDEGKVIVNPENYQTGNEKVFAGGDCINGGKEVVNAAYDGKKAAHGIHEYLSK